MLDLLRSFSTVLFLISLLFSAIPGIFAGEESKGGTRGGEVFDEVINAQGASEPAQTPLLPQLGDRFGIRGGNKMDAMICKGAARHEGID